MEINNYNKFFFIGFNKTGTTTIHFMLRNNNYNSIHCERYTGDWIRNDEEKNREIWLNQHKFFTDSERHNFMYLDTKFINSIFILNTRNLFDWIKSRYKWLWYTRINRTLIENIGDGKNKDDKFNHPFDKCIHEDKTEIIIEFIIKRNIYYKKIYDYFISNDKKYIRPVENEIINNKFIFMNINNIDSFAKYLNLEYSPSDKYFKNINNINIDDTIIYETFNRIGIKKSDIKSDWIVDINLSSDKLNYYNNKMREWD